MSLSLRLSHFAVALAFVSMVGALCASAQNPTANGGNAFASQSQATPVGSLKHQSRWAFRTKPTVTVSSQIVRLRDVVTPLDADMAGWPQLGRSLIGLVPLDGRPMVITRERLSKSIQASQSSYVAIDWVGPTRVELRYERPLPGSIPVSVPTARAQAAATGVAVPPRSTSSANIAQVSHVAARPTSQSSETVPRLVAQRPLSATAARTVLNRLHSAMEHQADSPTQTHAIKIDPAQLSLVPLANLVGMPRIEVLDPLPEGGPVRLRVVARSRAGEVSAIVEATATAHPMVVVATSSLSRGHRIQASDVILKPVPESEVGPEHLRDLRDLIGMEARKSIRADQPIAADQFGPPIVIRRGDLVDVRVLGGGITVTTSAKALGEGSESDTIEIETTSPRKRLLARVVQSGLVEIVTRAPRVRQ